MVIEKKRSQRRLDKQTYVFQQKMRCNICSKEYYSTTQASSSCSSKKYFSLKHMGVSKNWGTPKSSILIGFSILNHTFWGSPIFGTTHIQLKSNWMDRILPLWPSVPFNFPGKTRWAPDRSNYPDDDQQEK